MRFIKGTTNRHKIRELWEIMNPLQLQLDVTDPIDPPETMDNFAGNSRQKTFAYAAYVLGQLLPEYVKSCGSEEIALAIMRHERIYVIGEDSGLCVAALNDLPGPWSARFSDFAEVDVTNGRLLGHRDSGRGRDEIDAANNVRLMELMRDVPPQRRVAKFVSALTVVDITDLDGEPAFEAYAESYGHIATEMRGRRGGEGLQSGMPPHSRRHHIIDACQLKKTAWCGYGKFVTSSNG
ncbi:non-canonical purine NTP pyrophosphatase [Patescibacteria group bacterium]